MESVKILCLHKISNKKFPSWPAMPLKTFEKLLKYISKKYRVCLPSEIIPNSKKKQLILSFDDGFEDFYLNAFPLLKKHNVPAVLNVVVNCIDNNHRIWTQRLNDVLDSYAQNYKSFEVVVNGQIIKQEINPANAEHVSLSIFKQLLPLDSSQRDAMIDKLETNAAEDIHHTKMMNLSQLKEVSEYGIMIGSHSMTHPNLQIGDSDESILEFEMSESKKQLEGMLGKAIESFAFPNGMYSDISIRIAKDCNYKYLFLVDNNPAQYDFEQNTQILDRILIYSDKHWKNLMRIENYHNKLKRWLR